MNHFELLRYERGLTRSEVSAETGIPESTLRTFEDGTTVKPRAPHAKTLADFYGVSVVELLGLDDRSAA